MSEYLVLLKINPGRIVETLGAIRNLSNAPVPGVNLYYAMNIFGAWDVGIWVNAESSNQVLEFTQEKIRAMAGVAEVYTVPTFPHGNIVRSSKSRQETKQETREVPLRT
jgi:hypothetical protein